MSENGKILKISSKYLLNDIFSFLEYNYVLKLIKYNKNLQNLFNVKSQYYYYKIIKEKKIINEQKDKKPENGLCDVFKSAILFSIISEIMTIPYILIPLTEKNVMNILKKIIS